MHRKTKCTQYGFSIWLTREDVCGLNTWHTWKMNAKENPMAQTSVSPPTQTSHSESEPTTSTWLWKPPTQLNTPNIFVPSLVRVSPNASDTGWAGVFLLLGWTWQPSIFITWSKAWWRVSSRDCSSVKSSVGSIYGISRASRAGSSSPAPPWQCREVAPPSHKHNTLSFPWCMWPHLHSFPR